MPETPRDESVLAGPAYQRSTAAGHIELLWRERDTTARQLATFVPSADSPKSLSASAEAATEDPQGMGAAVPSHEGTTENERLRHALQGAHHFSVGLLGSWNRALLAGERFAVGGGVLALWFKHREEDGSSALIESVAPGYTACMRSLLATSDPTTGSSVLFDPSVPALLEQLRGALNAMRKQPVDIWLSRQPQPTAGESYRGAVGQ